VIYLLCPISPPLRFRPLGRNNGGRREVRGDMIVTRYADDIVIGFEHENDARAFWKQCAHGLRSSLLRSTLRRPGSSSSADTRRTTALCVGSASRRPSPFWVLLSSAANRAGAISLSRGNPKRPLRAKLKEIRRSYESGDISQSQTGKMARGSRQRLLCVPRSADELTGARRFSRTCDPSLASRHPASQPAG